MLDDTPSISVRRSLSTRTAIREGDIPKRLFLFSYWSTHHKSAPMPYSIQDSNVSFAFTTTMKITGLAKTNTGRIRFLHFDRPHGDSEPGAARQGLVNTTTSNWDVPSLYSITTKRRHSRWQGNVRKQQNILPSPPPVPRAQYHAIHDTGYGSLSFCTEP